MILAFTGHKYSGKNTVATIVEELVGQTSTVRRRRQIAFADPLKKIAADLYDLSHRQLHGDLKEVVDERWGVTPRFIMQQLGSEVVRRIHSETWIRYLFRTIREIEDQTRHYNDEMLWLITDVRLQNEARAVRDAGGFIWRVERPSLGPSTDSHESETELRSIETNETIVNDSTLVALEQSVLARLRRILPDEGL